MATIGCAVAEFAYDYMSRRYSKVVEGTSTNLFLWDGWLLVSETQHSILPSFHSFTNFYTWGLDLSQSLQGAGGIGGLLCSVTSSGEVRHYTFDGNGNVAELIRGREPGQLIGLTASYDWDAYGNLLAYAGTEALSNPIRWSTKYWDDETGLGYWGYRYYNGDHWLSRDPIGEEETLSLYVFVKNDPCDEWDWIGLSAKDDTRKALVAASRFFEQTTVNRAILYNNVLAKLWQGFNKVRNFSYETKEKYGWYDPSTRAIGIVKTEPINLPYPGASEVVNSKMFYHELTHATDHLVLGMSMPPFDATEGHAFQEEWLLQSAVWLVVMENKLKDTSLNCDAKLRQMRIAWRKAWKCADYRGKKKYVDDKEQTITATDHDSYVSQYGLRFRCNPEIRDALNYIVARNTTCCFRFVCEATASFSYRQHFDEIPVGFELPENLVGK